MGKWPSGLSLEDRIAAARAVNGRLVDLVLELLALHEANRIIVYSDQLARQIPSSHGAHAFNLFQRTGLFFEIGRLCALWDPPAEHQISIPSVVKLIEGSRELLGDDIERSWLTVGESGLSQEFASAFAERERAFGREQRARLLQGLEHAVRWTARVEQSSALRDLVNFRNKYLAHALVATRAEAVGRKFSPPRHGVTGYLLGASTAIVERLYLAVCNTSFDFRDSRRIARRRATALWNHCRFDVSE